ncbi:MAG: hypothetical protein ACLP6G_05535 [Terriglobales bacterium]
MRTRPSMLLQIMLLLGAAVPMLYAQQPVLEDQLLSSLTGKWVLSGTIRKTSTTHDVDIQWVLNHQFVEIHEVSRERLASDSTKPQYEAIVLIGWDADKQQYVVYWTDVFGGGFSMRGYAEKLPSSIPVVFKADDGNFYTTFAYDEKTKTWRWIMDNENTGKRQEFARLTMTR